MFTPSCKGDWKIVLLLLACTTGETKRRPVNCFMVSARSVLPESGPIFFAVVFSMATFS